ncbi:MAG: hypothetical protein ACE5KZ_00190 [Candidatus Scalinduaceae bacterium]
MASMSKHERALSYAKRLKAAEDVYAEARAIRREVNSLVWSESNKPLPLDEKIAILEEAKHIILKGKRDQAGRIIIEAGDNSGIIDVITNIEQNLKIERDLEAET